MTPAEFIDENGGPTVIARRTGRRPGAVALWRHRNKIPRSAWPELLDAFPQLTMDDLRCIEAATAKAA